MTIMEFITDQDLSITMETFTELLHICRHLEETSSNGRRNKDLTDLEYVKKCINSYEKDATEALILRVQNLI